jgi:hypothetical protein
MSSIFDLSENKITPEFCASLGLSPVCGCREFHRRYYGTINGRRLWVYVRYRRRNSNVPKGEPHHDYLKITVDFYDTNLNKYKNETRTYKNIKNEVDLISCMRNVSEEFGVSIIKRE